VKTVRGTDYLWESIEGLKALLNFGSGKTIVDDVNVHDAVHARKKDFENTTSEIFSRYGDTLTWVETAIEYSDGSILLCAHVSSWGGTFGEDSNSTKYYALMPK
jgi:hypothetical protein